METLQLVSLSVARGSFRVDSVNLVVNEQEYLVIIGHTGSGKSTLLKAIVGAYAPVTGRVVVHGTDVTKYPPEKRGVVYVSQDYSLFNHMSVYANIEFGLRAKQLPRGLAKKAISEVTAQFGIEYLVERFPRTLSGGEQQKVALARALVTNPKVLLLDEPLSMVDPETKDQILITLKNIPWKYHCSVVHVTHDWDEAYALGNTIAVMEDGRIIEVGTSESIFERPAKHHTARLTGFQNIHLGTATADEQGSVVELDSDIKLRTGARTNGRVYVCVRPEWINTNIFEGTNILTGRVVSLLRDRLGLRVVVAVGETEFTMITDMQPSVGESLTFQVPAERVHLIPVGDGPNQLDDVVNVTRESAESRPTEGEHF